ncbi:uncharacterized protein ARMOST_06109 [Armillaria ostoyae]|uniref:Uncharacterized protein n=1 Tax=Armillaria ostoyae TaxID=47428 RepID=A0A284R234_ARMOS|nr:uncharacterized protein ARMOST_06109 [Armillaria ostoyae]
MLDHHFKILLANRSTPSNLLELSSSDTSLSTYRVRQLFRQGLKLAPFCEDLKGIFQDIWAYHEITTSTRLSVDRAFSVVVRSDVFAFRTTRCFVPEWRRESYLPP